jgi:hypothetical protein
MIAVERDDQRLSLAAGGRDHNRPNGESVMRLAKSSVAGEWIAADARTHPKSIGCLMPAAYERYVRILHPVSRGTGAPVATVPWQKVADHLGKPLNSATHWLDLIAEYNALPIHEQDGEWDAYPSQGSLPAVQMEALSTALADATEEPEACFFAVSEGWGDLRHEYQAGPRCAFPDRTMVLLEGSLRSTPPSMADDGYRSPNLWWPSDHKWAVLTEIDWHSTFVGCSDDVAQKILAADGLEAFQVEWPTDS